MSYFKDLDYIKIFLIIFSIIIFSMSTAVLVHIIINGATF
jgi:hypothetical protein